MKLSWANKSVMAKSVTIMVALIIVSLGLCGVNGVINNYYEDFSGLAVIGYLGTWLGALGLVFLGIVAIIQKIVYPRR